MYNVLQNNSLAVNTSWEHLLLRCVVMKGTTYKKSQVALRISIQSIFALYLQTGLLGTLEEKKSLRFFSTAYERRVWSNKEWEFPWSVTLFQAQQSKALPRQFRATVFRLLSKMVREKLRILLNSKIQAVHLRVLFRTDGVDWPSCRPLKSSPGLLDQSLKGIWKGMRGFSGTSLWSWSANTRNNFAHEQSTVPGWHRPPRSDCWALGEDRVAAGFVLGQQRQLWWLSTVQNLPGTPLQISSQETSLNLPSSSFILQRQWFFF